MKSDIGYSLLDFDDLSRQQPIPVIQYPISATSISVTLFPNSHTRFRILSVHRQVCNLINEQGDVIALVHPSVGNGPFHVVLARSVSFAAMAAGEPVHWRGNSIQVGHVTIDLSMAAAWDPALPPAGETIPATSWSHLRAYMMHRGFNSEGLILWGSPGDESPGYRAAPDSSGYESAVTARAQQAEGYLLAGLRAGRESDIVRGTELLAGLGIGLTPAGDDFLLGFMARIWLEPALLPPTSSAPDLCEIIARTAGPRTTHLSRTWLDYAARGQFAEPWHDLAAALAAKTPVAIQHAADRILSIGASSGQDAMAGFLIMDRSNSVRNV